MNARQLFDADDASTASTSTDAGETRVVNFHHIKDTALWDKVNHRFTDDNYVYCGRRNATYGLPESIWHNPFKGEGAIEKFRDYLIHSPHIARLEELRGKVLVCWCKPKACHCDVLVEAIESGGNNPRRFLFTEPEEKQTATPHNNWQATTQTRHENAYTDAIHAVYLRTHPRALARRQHATGGMAARQLAHAIGLPTGYAVAITDGGRLVRCYGAAMNVYYER